MNPHRSPQIRSALRTLTGLALAAGLAGCADMSMAPEASGGSSLGTPQAKTGAADAGANGGHGGGYASADAGTSTGGQGGGTMTPAADQGIGLKPGGAQDIAFFRQKLIQKVLPKPGDMTIEGWLNEHDTVLPAAKKDRAVTLHALAGVLAAPQGDVAAAPEAVLQIGLNSGKSLADVQTSLALTVVIDRSGSMSGDKLAYVKVGLHTLADGLPKGTQLALYTFSKEVQLIFPAAVVGSDNLPKLHAAIDAIVADGGTNIYDGLKAGMATCLQAPASFQQRRIMFLSDGQPTVGDTNPTDIIGLAGQSAKAGCSVSSVGVGMDFSPSLMNGIAQKGNGTAWFLQNAEHAKNVFIQDLETMLLPVAEKLTLQFKFAAGWKVQEIYGFDWVEKDGVVAITGPKSAPATPGDPNPPAPDPTNPGEAPVAMPTLFASQRNGLVMVRIAPPAGVTADKIADLTLCNVAYAYTLSKGGTQEQFSVPVQVPGLAPVPDGGFAYFADPSVHRAWLLLRDGQALIQATAQADQGDKAAAKATLAAAKAVHDAHMAMMQADLLKYDASVPNLDDAAELLAALGALLAP